MANLVRSRSGRLAAGDSRHDIDGDLRAGRATRLYYGLHALGADVRREDRWLAALRTQGQDGAGPLVLSHRSAAVALGLRWLPEGWLVPGAVVDVSSQRLDKHRQQTGMRIHKAAVDPCDVTLVRGLPCTSAARTLVDLIRYRYVGHRLGIALIDGALRDEQCGYDDLFDVLHRMPHRRGIRLSAAAVGLARTGVDSPGETYIRLDLVEGGVANEALDIPLEIRDSDGLLLARGDFGTYDLMLWGEYDGYDVHTQKPAFGKDRRGDRWLQGRGWEPMRYSFEDVGHPDRLAREWQRAAAAAPARILAADPRRSPELARAQAKLQMRLGLRTPPR